MSHSLRRLRYRALLFAALGTASCGRPLTHHDLAVNGMAHPEHAFRMQLQTGRADSALFMMSSVSEKKGDTYGPGDPLLRSLYAGVLAHYAGRWEQSAEALDRAVLLADNRVTKSVSRAALSVVTNDGALEYVPARTERLLIHYYAALDFAREGSIEAAAVEARRLSRLLERYDDESPGQNAGMRAFLRYFAGTIFEAAGERNDAAVAYRNADAGFAGLQAPDATARAGTGEVILLVERGFVAHKVEEALVVALDAREVRALSGEHDDTDDYDRSDVIALVAGRVLRQAAEPIAGRPRQRTRFISLPEKSARRHRTKTCRAHAANSSVEAVQATTSVQVSQTGELTETVQTVQIADSTPAQQHQQQDRASVSCERRDDDNDANPYLLKIAWPAFEYDQPVSGSLAVHVGDDSVAMHPLLHADVSRAVTADFDAQRAGILARTILRAATKLTLTKTAEKSAGKKNEETVGRVLGALTNLGGVLTERADTRSWHLLPASVSIVRLRVPAGARRVRIQIGDGWESIHTLELPVEVRAGGMSFTSARVWR